MIGFLTGEVLFSDGSESIIQTSSGIGYQVFYNKVLVEGTLAAIYIANIGVNEIINAVNLESKSTLTKVAGLGTKGAAQIVLDLGGKIDRVKMFSDSTKIIRGGLAPSRPLDFLPLEEIGYVEETVDIGSTNQHEIMNDTLMACKELGFKEDKIIPIAQKILGANLITKPEQLIHLVLKEL